MKAKSLEIEAYTIAETTRKLGYKSSKTIYITDLTSHVYKTTIQ